MISVKLDEILGFLDKHIATVDMVVGLFETDELAFDTYGNRVRPVIWIMTV